MCEICCKWHSNPVNAFLHAIAFIVLIYGLWIHSAQSIGIAVVLAILGHLIQAVQKNSGKSRRKRR